MQQELSLAKIVATVQVLVANWRVSDKSVTHLRRVTIPTLVNWLSRQLAIPLYRFWDRTKLVPWSNCMQSFFWWVQWENIYSVFDCYKQRYANSDPLLPSASYFPNTRSNHWIRELHWSRCMRWGNWYVSVWNHFFSWSYQLIFFGSTSRRNHRRQ